MSITENEFLQLIKGCIVILDRFQNAPAERYYRNGKYIALRIMGISRNAHFKIVADN